MEIILLRKVENLGNLGDRVEVRSGFGRNYLIPTGRAVPATAVNVQAFEARRAELERLAAEALVAAEQRRQQLQVLSIRVARRAGDEGRLFGSVGAIDITRAVNEAGVALQKHEVRLSQGPFRMTGEYAVDLHLHSDVVAKLKIEIVPE
jgi:large subunit ribosomal protein L9